MTASSPSSIRYPEIDALRGLAIVLMMFYHLCFDLQELYGWDIGVLEGWWWIFARSIAILFLLISGVSTAISLERSGHLPTLDRWRKILKRFVVIFCAAMMVTIATYLIDPQTYIRFGILHLIAAAAILLPLTARLKVWNILLGIACLGAGYWITGTHIGTSLLLPFGLMPHTFLTVDYFPLLPWFGFILIGYGVGYFFYIKRNCEVRSASCESTQSPIHYQSKISLRAENKKIQSIRNYMNSPFAILGRQALIIYLLHQPLLLFILSLILGLPRF